LDLLAPWLQILLNTLKYSAIADLHTFQFTFAHALGFPVFISRLLATDLNAKISTSNYYEINIENSNYIIAIVEKIII
jgi:hypothetical protein